MDSANAPFQPQTGRLAKRGQERERGRDPPVLHDGNQIDLLVDGPAALDAMLSAIGSAVHHVHLEFYIYKSTGQGEPGQRLAQALQAKVREGVEVCFLYDPVGSRKTPRSFFEHLAAHGIRVLEYNPVNPFRIRGKWQPNRRDHRKVLIVDGRVAVTGGIDISKHYSREAYRNVEEHKDSSEDRGWRDVDIRIDGPAVAEFQQLFLETWRRQKGCELNGNYFPPPVVRGGHRVCVLKARPGALRNAVHDAYLDAIRQAQGHIHIVNAYFMPDKQIVQALRQAAESGVDVKLVLPGFSDFSIVIPAQRYHYAALLRAGVRIYERQKTMLHAKAAVVDGTWSTVGSYNLDMRSKLHAEEVNVVIFGEEFAARISAMFEEDIAHSNRILMEDWQRRSLLERTKEWLAHRFHYWT